MTEKSTALAKRDPVALKDTAGTRKQLVSKFGSEFSDGLNVETFVGLCRIYGLNPFMGHIAVIQGRPYIERDGWMHLINREAPGQLVSIDTRQATKREYETYEVDEGDYFAIATIERQQPGGAKVKYIRRAIIKRARTKPTETEQRKGKARHIVEDPWDMAEKQALVRALRMAFNDVLTKVGGESLPTEAQLAAENGHEPEAVEGEVVKESPPDPPPTQEEADDEVAENARAQFWARAKEMLDPEDKLKAPALRAAVHDVLKVGCTSKTHNEDCHLLSETLKTWQAEDDGLDQAGAWEKALTLTEAAVKSRYAGLEA